MASLSVADAPAPTWRAAVRGYQRATLLALGALVTCLWSSSSQACGGGAVAPLNTQIGVNVQRILLSIKGGKTEVITQVAVPQTKALTINDLNGNILRAGGYSAAVKDAVSNNKHRAFIVESATSRAQLQRSVPADVLELIDSNATVTRLSTVLPAEALTYDVTLNVPLTSGVPNRRVLSWASQRQLRGVGLAMLLGVALVVRRGRRRAAERG
ncbi:MAG TPA: hypothetical protein VFQ61_36090 [Polyangiaceae bacterium]|nr:hypothetical protein [Polyangiaceae bacterium]